MARHSRLRVAAGAALGTLALSTAAQGQACGAEVVLKRLDAGAAGPELTTPDGAPVIGGPFSMRVVDALPNASGALVFSPVEAPFFDPTYGATFYFGVPFKTGFFTTDSEGNGPIEFALAALDPSLCGGFVIFQAGVFDPAAQNGIAVSNALRLVVGENVGRLFDPELPSGQEGRDLLFGDVDGDGLRDFVATGPFSLRLGLPGGGFAATGPDYSVGGGDPHIVDIDGDGNQDLLLSGGVGFIVMLGDGAGDFTGIGSFGGTTGGVSVVPGDFDLNGTLDVITASSNGTAFHPGTGTGFFNLPTLFPTGAAVDVVGGDLNEDGFQDLVSVLETTDRVMTLTGDGTASFQLNGPFIVGLSPERAAIGDFDGDTLLDVVTANRTPPNITLRPGNGNGFLSPITTTVPTGEGRPNDLLATDLNGDGFLDLAVVNDVVEDVTLMLGNGDGTFGGIEHLAAIDSPDAVGVTDYDLDGDLDMVVTGDGGHVLLEGDGAGRFPGVNHFQIGSSPVSTTTSDILVADMNNDGVDDAVIRSDQDVHVLLGSRTGPVINAGSTENADIVVLGDFNGDGFRDVALEDGNFSSQVSVLLNPGDGALGAPISFATDTVNFLLAEDVNGDLDTDLVTTHGSLAPGELAVWISNGDGTFALPVHYTSSNTFDLIEPADLDGDGFLDFVYAINNTLFVRINAGDGTLGTEVSYPSGLSPSQEITELILLDVGGDPELDLVYRCTGVCVRINQGDGTFGSEAIHNAGVPILTGDMNGDLSIDLIGGTQQLINDGNGVFTPGITVGTSFDETRLVDVTNDGVLDFVGIERTLASPNSFIEFGVRVGRGDGTFMPRVSTDPVLIPNTLFPPWDVFDLDGDAIPEAVIVGDQNGDVTVFEGNGDGTYLAAETYSAFLESIGDLAAVDLDGDGILDLLATSEESRAALLTNRLGE